MTGSQVPTWEKQALESPVSNQQLSWATPTHCKHLCQCQGEGEDPLSSPSHLLRKEEYPPIFFFSEMNEGSQFHSVSWKTTAISDNLSMGQALTKSRK